MADEVEREDTWCQEAMGNVLDPMVKKSESAPDQRSDGKRTSRKEGRRSEERNGGDRTRMR